MNSIKKALLFVCICLISGQLSAQTDVLTQHNNLERTGWNSKETQLKVSNVSNTTFGLLFKRLVDDQIYMQPLIVSGVLIGGVSKNIVYVATTNNSVYAFDADNGAVGSYWEINLTPNGMRPPQRGDIRGGSYADISGNMGIIGTPVIDKSANTLYLVSRWVDPSLIVNSGSFPSTGFHQFLYAIDLSTGNIINSVEISATVNGTAPGNTGNQVHFDPRRQNQRAGLLLLNGVVYIPYASHGDWMNYHGWLLGYDASNLNQVSVYNTAPNDGWGGIWMSGAAPAAETPGNGSIYLTSGNSGGGSTPNGPDPSILENRGESVLKLVPNAPGPSQSALTIADWFTPTNYATLNNADLDFGSQVMIVPNTNMLVTGCKDYYMYVMDKTNMGKYNTVANSILQKYFVGNNAQFHSSLAYFGGATKQYVYQFADQQVLSAYPVVPGIPGSIDFVNDINGSVKGGIGNCGSFMSVSSNGSDESTGILWITNSASSTCDANQKTCPGVLYAVNASDVSKTLWTSKDNAADDVGNFAKNSCPTIANGKVYLATFSNSLNVYGLLASNPRCVTNVALNKTAVASSNGGVANQAFDGNMTTDWNSNQSDPQSIYVDLGAQYDLCKVAISWNSTNFAQDFDIDVTDVDPVANPGSWVNVTHITGNASPNTEFAGSFSGRYVRMNGLARPGTGGYIIHEMQVFGQPATVCAAPTGLTKGTVTQNTAHISWTAVPGAVGYNFQYQNTSIESWISRNNITGTSIDISALSCGSGYSYQVQTICSSGETSSFSPGSFNTMTCTAPCGPLPTRRSHADIGDIGMAGSSCYASNVYTIKGSGTGFGGLDDQFQFAYYDTANSASFTTRVASQDAVTANNKAGILIKQSLSNTAPYAFIGTTSGLGAVFSYRSVDGAPATEVYLAGPKAPYYVRLDKVGTTYTAYVSATGTSSDWQQVGTTQDLGFGSDDVRAGLTVTSSDNSKLSTAVFDEFTGSDVLPITLVSFTAQNINDQYVSLHWTTATEENNDHFTLERSGDGIHFETITSIKAVGNSSVNQNYVYSDTHPVNGLNFYRLKQYDIDNRVAVFPLVQVRFGLDALPVVYPNPVTNSIHISSGKELVRSVRLMSMDGKEIMRNENLAGLQQITLNVSAMAAGVYLMEYKTDSKTYQQKIIKQ